MPLATKLIIATLLVSLGHAAGSWRLYDQYLWFDNLIHFFGGAWVVLVLLLLKNRFLFLKFLTGENSGSKIFKIVLTVLIIGLLWEAFEFSLDLYLSAAYGVGSNFQTTKTDTFFDLGFDALGAFLISFSLFLKKQAA